MVFVTFVFVGDVVVVVCRTTPARRDDRSQEGFELPLDPRPIRDRVAAATPEFDGVRRPPVVAAPEPAASDVRFLDRERSGPIVDAELVEVAEPEEDPDILFID